MCDSWELNPQPFALLTQCFTTEPQEHKTQHKQTKRQTGKYEQNMFFFYQTVILLNYANSVKILFRITYLSYEEKINNRIIFK